MSSVASSKNLHNYYKELSEEGRYYVRSKKSFNPPKNRQVNRIEIRGSGREKGYSFFPVVSSEIMWYRQALKSFTSTVQEYLRKYDIEKNSKDAVRELFSKISKEDFLEFLANPDIKEFMMPKNIDKVPLVYDSKNRSFTRMTPSFCDGVSPQNDYLLQISESATSPDSPLNILRLYQLSMLELLPMRRDSKKNDGPLFYTAPHIFRTPYFDKETLLSETPKENKGAISFLNNVIRKHSDQFAKKGFGYVTTVGLVLPRDTHEGHAITVTYVFGKRGKIERILWNNSNGARHGLTAFYSYLRPILTSLADNEMLSIDFEKKFRSLDRLFGEFRIATEKNDQDQLDAIGKELYAEYKGFLDYLPNMDVSLQQGDTCMRHSYMIGRAANEALKDVNLLDPNTSSKKLRKYQNDVTKRFRHKLYSNLNCFFDKKHDKYGMITGYSKKSGTMVELNVHRKSQRWFVRLWDRMTYKMGNDIDSMANNVNYDSKINSLYKSVLHNVEMNCNQRYKHELLNVVHKTFKMIRQNSYDMSGKSKALFLSRMFDKISRISKEDNMFVVSKNFIKLRSDMSKYALLERSTYNALQSGARIASRLASVSNGAQLIDLAERNNTPYNMNPQHYRTGQQIGIQDARFAKNQYDQISPNFAAQKINASLVNNKNNQGKVTGIGYA